MRERELQHEGEAASKVCHFSTFSRRACLASGHIILEVDAPDRHSLDNGIGVSTQGPAHGCSQRKEGIGSGDAPQYMLFFRLTVVAMIARGFLASLARFHGASRLAIVGSKTSFYPSTSHAHGKARCGRRRCPCAAYWTRAPPRRSAGKTSCPRCKWSDCTPGGIGPLRGRASDCGSGYSTPSWGMRGMCNLVVYSRQLAALYSPIESHRSWKPNTYRGSR